ncbi:MAG: hypothetical protein LBP28_01365 [Coriobacteriales bacterium]|jgi:hypothetical protein|nr:hypothetical protein [Coriobacteriales bacterium]
MEEFAGHMGRKRGITIVILGAALMSEPDAAELKTHWLTMRWVVRRLFCVANSCLWQRLVIRYARRSGRYCGCGLSKFIYHLIPPIVVAAEKEDDDV